MRIVLGVSGGIAAYKVASLLRLLTESGHEVTVVPTAAALQFVGAATWEALSGRPVRTGVFEDVPAVPHVRLGQGADLVIVAPATADLLAKAATGRADDLLTSTLLTAHCPVAFAPAMHTEMWEHPATVANVATLRARGCHVIEPASGRLTGADTGPGRLPEPEHIAAEALALVARPDGEEESLRGRRVVVSAGGTREPIDPVRFLGNRSSGKQGIALAEVAAARGAQVTLVLANAEAPATPGVDVIHVQTALELQTAVTAAAGDADVVVMAAAVADFRPAVYRDTKLKKTHDAADPDAAPTIELVRNPDILAGLVADRGADPRPLIVGFAAETGDADKSVLDHGRDKLTRKGCDLLVVNEVGADKTFGKDTNTVTILRRGSAEAREIGPAPKSAIAQAVWDAAEESLADWVQ
ncbi:MULTISPECIES: bifunctional phosphopantothenoylcysteine decarboxylase/phosphopantothenate--cysteine ligase CoaBC [unclassified Janibacter]|uniref:bifunctional phosphopantothenoylcysteine decarboxylase/phosphopantothenate--cysteine ligase CoaBC n=1 Tax=unclassified Janibacter TaxID=2649294 RepID=UPI003D085D65